MKSKQEPPKECMECGAPNTEGQVDTTDGKWLCLTCWKKLLLSSERVKESAPDPAVVEFRFLNDPVDVREAAWVTARRNKDPDSFLPTLFYDYLIAEHSPIRRLILAWRVRAMSKRASSHFVRHVHSQPYVGGTRPDWFPDLADPETVDHLQDSNCQALIEMARRRLCRRAWEGTRAIMEEMKRGLMEADPSRIGPRGDAAPAYYRFLGTVLVPNCIYRAGCPEDALRGCGWWRGFVQRHEKEDLLDIKNRYMLYNEEFLKGSR